MRLRNTAIKCVCFCLVALFLVFTAGSGFSYAESGKTLSEKFGTEFEENNGPGSFVIAPKYGDIYAGYLERGLQEMQVEGLSLDLSQAAVSEGKIEDFLKNDPDLGKTYIYWENGTEWFEWEVDIADEGLYEIEIEYKTISGISRRDIERSIYIDGKIPFSEAENIVMYRLWTESGEPSVNFVGDQVWPKQEEVIKWNSITVYDKSALYSEPLRFHLTDGNHRIRITYTNEPVLIGGISFKPISPFITYSEYISEFNDVPVYSGDEIKIEAEDNVLIKNNISVRRESDSDPATSPISRGARVLNVYGGWRWREGNQSVTWEIEVPEDGLYNIGMKVSQFNGSGLPAFRRIEIDGEVPFYELNEYMIPYDNKWQMEVLGNEDGEYLFYLSAGKHEITITVIMGMLGEMSLLMEKDSFQLSEVLRQIFLLAGSEPDPNFDYEFEKNIPNMVSELQKIIDNMKIYLQTLDEICTSRPEVYTQIAMIEKTMSLFISNRFRMASRVNDLRTVQDTLTSVFQEMRYSYMTHDYFLAGNAEKSWYSGVNSNFIQRFYTTIVNFIRSFKVDYGAVSGTIDAGDTEYEVLNVWMGTGMEWAEIIKNMADELFTPETGIVLSVNLLPPGQFAQSAGGVNVLLLSLTAGNAPDMATGVQGSMPVEFAIRDAALDLEQFDDFEEVTKRFLPQTLIPLQYMGGTYALPETMSMQLLFYRKDIITELGIKVPDTWEELAHTVLPVLYRNNMNFVFPPDYSAFLYQNGGSFYDENGLKTMLDSEEANKAFSDFTFMFMGYGLDPINLSLYQKFRTGELPMGIGDQLLYMQLLFAAPEIAGRWGVAPLPGTRREDGTIDRSTGNMATISGSTVPIGVTDYSMMAFKKNDSKAEQRAWEYMKWWTSTEIQTRFCEEVESQIAVSARWHTANLEAYQNIPWDKEHLTQMMEQWKWYRGTPVVLGGYFTPRHIRNAWTDVIMGGYTPRDALEKAIKEINIEMRRKQEEYGIYAGD